MNRKVLVVGGDGHFGRLLVEDLRRHVDCELVIGDRTSANLFDSTSIEHALAGVSVAICVAGPFQELPTTLAESCLRLGIHYIDFADDRQYRGLVSPADWLTTDQLSEACAKRGFRLIVEDL
jgi:saccharopine dehydrogenase-like NADP-dependent oxidoreductase